MITSTSFLNPKFCKKVRRSLWLAQMQAIKTKKRSTEYVKNRKGHAVLRLDVLPSGELTVYANGRGMVNYASVILKVLEG